MALGALEPEAAAREHRLTVSDQGIGPDGNRFVTIDPKDTAGIRTRFIEPLEFPSVDGPAYKIDHLGIASDDTGDAIRVFAGNLGCPIDSSQTDIEVRNITESFVSDKYGAIYHARPPEIMGGLRTTFMTVGDCELECMMDYDPSHRPIEQLGEAKGNTKGDQSAIAKFVARRGSGLAHIAFATRDINAVLSKLEGDGWRVIDLAGRPGGRGSLIGFIHPSNFGGGLLMHFVEPQADGGYAAKFG